ncbi:hypothetical protein [Streptomyces sp. NPDC057580]|uniref:hypothetical protein n=1 Tax=Streptomyces sp. NPDC057580 TaxID=3346173 RepID=UPI0036CA8344
MSTLELRQTDDSESFDLYADGKRVGTLWWHGEHETDEEVPEDFQPGWELEMWGSNLWGKSSEPDPDIQKVVALARDLNEERAEHERKMNRIDRNRPRTVSIPSGGQPK